MLISILRPLDTLVKGVEIQVLPPGLVVVPRARGRRDQVGERAALADPAPGRQSRGRGVGWTGIGTARRAWREGRAVGAAPRLPAPAWRPEPPVAFGLANVI